MPDGKWVSKENLQTFWQMIRSKVLPTMIGDTVTTWLTEHVDPVGSAVVVDNTLTIEGAAADAKKTGDEISGLKEELSESAGDLKSALETISGNIILPVNYPKSSIDLSGSTVTMSEGIPVASTENNYNCRIYSCSQGQIITVSGTGGYTSRLCGFVDVSGNVLYAAPQSVAMEKWTITVPSNTSWVIINTRRDYDSFAVLGNTVAKDVSESKISLDELRIASGINCFNQEILTSAAGVTRIGNEYVGTAFAFIGAFPTNNYIPVVCKSNTPYTLSLKAYTEGNAGTTGNLKICIVRDNGTTANLSIPNDTSSYTAFVVSSTNVVGISFDSGNNKNNIWHFKEIILAEGTSASPYEPFYSANDRLVRELVTEYENYEGIPVALNDIHWMYGNINLETGGERTVQDKTHIKSGNYLTDISEIRCDYKLGVCYYDKYGDFISSTNIDSIYAVWTENMQPANTKYLRILVYGTTMNISDIYEHIIVKQRKSGIYNFIDCVNNNKILGKSFKYSGDRICLNNYGSFSVAISGIDNQQDGVIMDDVLYLFTSHGYFTVIDMITTDILATNCGMDNVVTDTPPHCNSVCCGKERNSENIPYVYVNAYNTTGLPRGTCYVYSITNQNAYYASLVQTITLNFTNTTLWTDGTSVRPYGNFAIDDGGNYLYAITQYSSSKMRMFKFALPEVIANTTVTLSESDILEQYDLPIMLYIQGSIIHGDYLYQLSGFGTNGGDTTYPGYCNAVNLKTKSVSSIIALDDAYIDHEPEFVDVYDNSLLVGAGHHIYSLKF